MDINNFGPFNASVWGTISDWFMTVVTSLTAIYLIKTFKSQQVIQSLQQESIRLDKFRHRELIKPHFSFESSTHSINSTDETHSVTVKFEFISLDNPAFNINFLKTTYNHEVWRLSHDLSAKPQFKTGEGIAFYGTFEVLKRSNNQQMYVGTISFIVEYLDADNNRYNQQIDFSLVNESYFKSINLPVFIP